MLQKPLLAMVAMIIGAGLPTAWADEPAFNRKTDLIYGRKDGMALTMDVFAPKKANGAAVVLAVSGGYFSGAQMINPGYLRPLLDRGYTVFAVVHGSQPRYQVPDIIRDMQRAVRFIRHHAKDYGIDAARIGATGGSSGGNLSLMIGIPSGKGDPKARDPVDRESSQVQAVACFFPPTDFLHFGGKELIRAIDHAPPFRASFDYRDQDQQSRIWERVTDPEKLREMTRSISPIYHVSKDSAPTFIIHGDKDTLVPVQQAETFIGKMKEAGVPCELVIRNGAGHGWLGMEKDTELFADWFDKYLAKKGEDKSAND